MALFARGTSPDLTDGTSAPVHWSSRSGERRKSSTASPSGKARLPSTLSLVSWGRRKSSAASPTELTSPDLTDGTSAPVHLIPTVAASSTRAGSPAFSSSTGSGSTKPRLSAAARLSALSFSIPDAVGNYDISAAFPQFAVAWGR